MLLAYPLLGVRFTGVLSANTLPDTVSAGHVAEVMSRDFPAPISDEEQIVVAAPSHAQADVVGITDTLRTIEGVAAVSPPRPLDDEHWLMKVTLTGQPLSESSRAALTNITALDLTFPVQMTGPTADALAINDSLGRHLPTAALILITATLVVLFAMTTSVVLPIKAVIMNALSLAAALGVVTFVFQDGHLTGLLNTTGHGGLEPTSLIVLAAVAFGLSTDYGVFLLARIKESHDLGLSNRRAVTSGIEHTGRIVTSAATLLCLSMCALLLSRLWFVQELGLGAALAVILDATIVRAILVAALMALLGSINWWAPRTLRRVHSE
jgi:RND superfamily putative drug exporter